MYQLCRHIMPSSQTCGSPALKGTLFCFNHTAVRATLAKVAPRPDPYGIHTPLPFVYSEDRAALQLNYSIVVAALNDQRINLQTANAFNRLFRSCEINLSHGPLHEPDPEHAAKNIVQRVILTPEGEEVAEARSALEEGEPALVHGKECPCRPCAEQYRGAAPEQHHYNCRCGLCKAPSHQPSAISVQQPTDQPSALNVQNKTELSSRPESAPADAAEGPALSLPKGPALPQPSHEAQMNELSSRPESAQADAAEGPALPQPTDQPSALNVQNKKELSSRPERSAAEEPALSLPKGPALPHSSHESPSRPKEGPREATARAVGTEQIRKNQQAARKISIGRFPDIPPDEPCPSWGEEHGSNAGAVPAVGLPFAPLDLNH